MKRKKSGIKRLKSMIDKDRLSATSDFFNLVTADLNKVLSEYFELKDLPRISAEKNGDTIEVMVDFVALRIKKFGTIPK